MKRKNVLTITIVISLFLIAITFSSYIKKDKFKNQKNLLELTTQTQTISFPRKFDTVPGGNNVYRSNQPTLKQLKLILETHDIQTVIRMNDTEGTGVSPYSEKKLVQGLGKKYIWINAHLGYKKDSGYVESLRLIQPYLESGKVLIHCTAGADRTGYQVAKYIQNKLKWSKKEIWIYTIKYNHWESHICKREMGYIRYMEAFYTMREWCFEIGKSCTSCL